MLLLDQAFSPPGTAGGQPTQSDADKAEMAYLGRMMMHLHQERAPRVLEAMQSAATSAAASARNRSRRQVSSWRSGLKAFAQSRPPVLVAIALKKVSNAQRSGTSTTEMQASSAQSVDASNTRSSHLSSSV